MQNKSNLFASIQIARAIAVGGVLLWHLEWIYNGLTERSPFQDAPHFILFGRNGVDLFFCISGFIVAHIVADRKISARDFVVRRIVRIYPFAILFTSAFVFIKYMGCLSLQSNSCSIFQDPVELLKSYALFPQKGFPALGVLWTLEHEIIFYLISFLVCVILRFSPMVLMGVLIVLASVGVVIHAIIPTYYGFIIWDYHLFSLYQIEFAAGIGIYTFKDKYYTSSHMKLIVISAIVFCLTTLAINYVPEPRPKFGEEDADLYGLYGVIWVVGYTTAASLFLIGLINAEAGHNSAGSGGRRRMTALLVLIGNASYAIYLIHPIIYGGIGKAFEIFYFGDHFVILAMVTGVVSTIAISVAWYSWGEIPFLRLMQKVLR
jgi:exopolysaccharide production protein ExoZ